jgi:hypothetical protein
MRKVEVKNGACTSQLPRYALVLDKATGRSVLIPDRRRRHPRDVKDLAMGYERAAAPVWRTRATTSGHRLGLVVGGAPSVYAFTDESVRYLAGTLQAA